MSHCLKDSSRPLGTEGEGKRGKGRPEGWGGLGGWCWGLGHPLLLAGNLYIDAICDAVCHAHPGLWFSHDTLKRRQTTSDIYKTWQKYEHMADILHISKQFTKKMMKNRTCGLNIFHWLKLSENLFTKKMCFHPFRNASLQMAKLMTHILIGK